MLHTLRCTLRLASLRSTECLQYVQDDLSQGFCASDQNRVGLLRFWHPKVTTKGIMQDNQTGLPNAAGFAGPSTSAAAAVVQGLRKQVPKSRSARGSFQRKVAGLEDLLAHVTARATELQEQRQVGNALQLDCQPGQVAMWRGIPLHCGKRRMPATTQG